MAEPDEAPFDPRRRGLKRTAVRAGHVARAALHVVRAVRFLSRRLLELVLALVIIFEEWGWRPLAALLAGLARFRPVAALEAWISALPPYGALAVFALPSALLFPLKLLALILIAQGKTVLAGGLFVGAKLAGTALLARIFQLTQPALMRIGWFAWAHGRFMPWKEALTAWVRESSAWRYGRVVKARVKRAAEAAWHRWRPLAEPYVARVRALFRSRQG